MKQNKQEAELIERVVIEPGASKRVVVGVFEKGMKQPVLSLSFQPQTSDSINSFLSRVDKNDEYQLIYYFQSFSSVLCTISIYQKYV